MLQVGQHLLHFRARERKYKKIAEGRSGNQEGGNGKKQQAKKFKQKA
jgi:hypothetical protein